MNPQNLENLEKTLIFKGFGEKFHTELKEKILIGDDNFQLNTSMDFGGKKVDYALNFNRGRRDETYFLNSFEASIPGKKFPKAKTSIAQTFYLDKGKGVSAKEAFNLLEGRAVKKTLTTNANRDYKAWLQLDFNTKNDKGQYKVNRYGENYKFDLEATLGKYKIKELDDPKLKKYLLESLERGNIHSVTMVRDEKKIGDGTGTDAKERKTFIEASPMWKTLNVFDENMKKVYQENKKQVEEIKVLNNITDVTSTDTSKEKVGELLASSDLKSISSLSYKVVESEAKGNTWVGIIQNDGDANNLEFIGFPNKEYAENSIVEQYINEGKDMLILPHEELSDLITQSLAQKDTYDHEAAEFYYLEGLEKKSIGTDIVDSTKIFDPNRKVIPETNKLLISINMKNSLEQIKKNIDAQINSQKGVHDGISDIKVTAQKSVIGSEAKDLAKQQDAGKSEKDTLINDYIVEKIVDLTGNNPTIIEEYYFLGDKDISEEISIEDTEKDEELSDELTNHLLDQQREYIEKTRFRSEVDLGGDFSYGTNAFNALLAKNSNVDVKKNALKI